MATHGCTGMAITLTNNDGYSERYYAADGSHTHSVAGYSEYYGTSAITEITEKRSEQPMETLFNVIVVSKDRAILLEKKTVAENEEDAKFNVDIHSVLKEKGLKPKDVTIICNSCGGVKVRKEVQKVRVIKEDE